MIRVIPLFFFLLIFSTGFSQITIKGKVTDSINNPIEFANVFLSDNDKNTVGTTSDKTGFFELQLPEKDKKKYYLIISYLGFKNYTKSIDTSYDMDIGVIKLSADSNLLSEVVIKSNKPIIERKEDKLVFNVENSLLKKGFNGLDVLRRTPSLRINTDGEILTLNEKTLVLINGRNLNYSSDELSNYINSLNSEDIIRIEVQTVGSSNTTASNSGGVVNIILKNVATGFKSNLRTSFTIRDKEHFGRLIGLSNQFGSKKWNLYSRIGFTRNENVSRYESVTNFFDFTGNNENYGEVENEKKKFNANLGFVFYPNTNNEIATEFYFSKDIVNRIGADNLSIFKPELTSAAVNETKNYNKNNLWNVVLNYSLKLDSLGSNIRFIGDVGNKRLDNNNEVFTEYTYGSLSNNANKFITNAKSDFYDLQIDWEEKNRKGNTFQLGMKFSKTLRDNVLDKFDFLDNNWVVNRVDNQDFENNEDIFASYLLFTKQWRKKHTLKLGLRTEYTSIKGKDYINNTKVKNDYLDWFPSLYYSRVISKKQDVSLAYSRRIKRPRFSDLNPFIIKVNDFYFQTGNPQLNPQYTDKLNLTYQLNRHSFSLYGNITRDLIAGVYTTENDVSNFKPENFGKASVVGFAYSYSGNLISWLRASINTGVWKYYFRTKNIENSQISFYNTLNMQIKFNKDLFLDISSDYTSKNQFQVVELANQFWLDIALQKNIMKGNGTLRLSLDDAFNTIRNKNISIYENFNFQFYQKNITRSISVIFTYNFNNKQKFKSKKVKKNNNNIFRL